jgi:hypothetical protein
MKLKLWLILGLVALLGWSGPGRALASLPASRSEAPPLLIVVADKLDSIDILDSKLPGFCRLLQESSSGLMCIRSRAGYTKSNSGYLSLGAGTRCATSEEISGLMAVSEPFAGLTAGDFWSWAMSPVSRNRPVGLVVPEVGRAAKLLQKTNPSALPGLLGGFFRANGWQTIVYSNNDRFEALARPGGLLLMDRQGKIDGGRIDAGWTVADPQFPYLTRIDPDKTLALLQTAVKPRRVVLFDFDDFARLDYYRDAMLAAAYQRAKRAALRRLDHLLLRIMEKWPARQLSLVVVSPSNSWEAINQKRYLAPLLIRSADYRRGGVLTSGTTNWPGIVSNIDFLPTLLALAHLTADRTLDGRTMQAVAGLGQESYLTALHQRINTAQERRRQILDWYLSLITVGWLLGLACPYLKLGKLGEGILTGVAVIPLVMILMPLLPAGGWQVSTFLVLTVGLALLFMLAPDYQNRFLMIAAITWGVLVVDQISGWHLIRYSPLGYSPAAGARNYGMGNEFMGIFLSLSLLLADMIAKKFRQRWLALVILGISAMVLGLPQLGINFGGTLAALVGFFWYLSRVYYWDWRNQKLWLTLGVGLALIFLAGYWDSLRPIGQQTHIGRFFGLIFSNRFGRVLIIIGRKFAMNLKLMAASPWTRIVWLALGLSLAERWLARKPLFVTATRRVGPAILIAGLAAFAFNDSGIVALATALAFGFTYLLLAFQKENKLVAGRSSFVAREGPNPD